MIWYGLVYLFYSLEDWFLGIWWVVVSIVLLILKWGVFVVWLYFFLFFCWWYFIFFCLILWDILRCDMNFFRYFCVFWFKLFLGCKFMLNGNFIFLLNIIWKGKNLVEWEEIDFLKDIKILGRNLGYNCWFLL